VLLSDDDIREGITPRETDKALVSRGDDT